MRHEPEKCELVLNLRADGHEMTKIPDLMAERGWDITLGEVQGIVSYARTKGDERAAIRTNAVYGDAA